MFSPHGKDSSPREGGRGAADYPGPGGAPIGTLSHGILLAPELEMFTAPAVVAFWFSGQKQVGQARLICYRRRRET